MDIDSVPASPPDWLAAFESILRAAVATPFHWGAHDCCTFAAACWRARTGADALAGLVWADEADAARLIKRMGGLRAAVESRIGPAGPALGAVLGDLVLAVDPADPKAREILAVCVGPHLVAPGAAGLAVLQLDAAVASWGVRHG